MRLGKILALFAVALLIGACSDTTKLVPTNTPGPIYGDQHTNVPPVSGDSDPTHVIELLSALKPYEGQDAADTNNPDWAGVRDDGKIIFGGQIRQGGAEEILTRASAWFSDRGVEGVIIHSSEWTRNRPQGDVSTLAIMSRDKMTRQNGSVTDSQAAESELAHVADIYARRLSPSAEPSGSEVGALIRQWAHLIAGDRVVDVFVTSNSVQIMVKPGTLSADDRIYEAARLGSFPMRFRRDVTVNYAGVGSIHSVKIESSSLVGWGRAGADVNQLKNWLEIDGQTAMEPPAVVQPLSDEGLRTLVLRRSTLKESLPGDAKLTIGKLRFHEYGMLEVTASVPGSDPWESAWSAWAPRVTELFADAPEVQEIHLVLLRGTEAEYHIFSRPLWRLREKLAWPEDNQIGSWSFLAVESWYDRYTVAGGQ